MEIAIVGDSHAGVLQYSSSVLNEFKLTVDGVDGRNWLCPQIEEEEGGFRVQANVVPKARPLNILLRPSTKIYFSGPFHTAPFCRSPAWNKFSPWKCYDNHPTRQPVPDSAIHQWVDRFYSLQLDFLRLLKRNGFDLRVVEAPRPLSRAPDLYKLSRDVVAEVDRICRRHVVARLSEIGIPVIFVPDETVADGFTLENYSARLGTDSHHGNREFSRLMMLKIRSDIYNAP